MSNRIELILAVECNLSEDQVASEVMGAMRIADPECFVILSPAQPSQSLRDKAEWFFHNNRVTMRGVSAGEYLDKEDFFAFVQSLIDLPLPDGEYWKKQFELLLTNCKKARAYIDEFKGEYYEGQRMIYDVVIEDAEETLKSTPAQEQKQDEWISVQDRLPENNELCNDMVMYWDNKTKCTKIGCYDYETDDWTDWGIGRSISKFIEVTHWQPLPQPPKQ
jgi:hypothetical protein